MSLTNQQQMPPGDQSAHYRIGTASRLTGIPVDTLRIWERRYSVVTPKRSRGSDRLYDAADIERLSLLKKLTERGYSIGDIATLDNEKLKQQLIDDQKAIIELQKSKLRKNQIETAVFGDVMPLRIKAVKKDSEYHDFRYCALETHLGEFEARLNQSSIDVLVLEYPALQEDSCLEIKRLQKLSRAKHIFIIYGFTNRSITQDLMNAGFTLLQAPVALPTLHQQIRKVFYAEPVTIENLLFDDDPGEAPSRLFSNQGLFNAASSSSVIKCECPQHLSEIIQKLIQFEIYSRDCENRDEKDRLLHQYLKNITGHARALMENALKHTLETEGLNFEKIQTGEK